ncbi:VOC family protein [Streptomyces sodiiphilus]|uniref:VOC family protein n=2 Tax=Streptomyces sodiiphilus TaxID=226217 RepID=A0ABP5ASG5_9ACTN
MTGMTPRIDLIGIVTSDLAASLEFYRRLGVEIPPGAEKEPHVEAVLPGGLRMAWDTLETIASFDPEGAAAGAGGRGIGLAFRCDGPADVDGQYRELVAAGYRGHKEPWDAFWGQRYAVVLDPDGNAVDLFAPLSAGG